MRKKIRFRLRVVGLLAARFGTSCKTPTQYGTVTTSVGANEIGSTTV